MRRTDPLLWSLPSLFLSLAAAEPLPPEARAELFPLQRVRILGGPFSEAAAANRSYLLALEPDRLLAPFLREAGLKPKAPSYENWENTGLDGHTAGHYLTALAQMIAAGEDTREGELKRRLVSMLEELERCQRANGDGSLSGVPGSRKLWTDVANGKIEAHGFGLNGKWVPWYNIHKTFAGLRDAWRVAGLKQAKPMFLAMGDWCLRLISGLSDEQMQDMLRSEHGGMNEVMADLYAFTGKMEYLAAARRFDHLAVLQPLTRREDRLTGLHANTQIPKVVGLARTAALAGDAQAAVGARFFWETVTTRRSVAFGGNSVGEHFHAPDDFRGLLESREGPETCNTYNMLRLTERLFVIEPKAEYADYYERALYNHILASIHPQHPGYVYFTPIRPRHYRVYSEPDHCFWCCVGSGIENPGKYGEFIYAKTPDGIHVNLFIPSELQVSETFTLRQETRFPFEETSRITLRLSKPSTFTLRLRHPAWVARGAFAITLNGTPVATESSPSSYVEIRREWHHEDTIRLTLPMSSRLERLPDGSDWASILHGPILLAARSGTENLTGLRADGSRMGHVAHGPTVPLDQATVLIGSEEEILAKLKPAPDEGPLHFHLRGTIAPEPPDGLLLEPFFRLHDERYQMVWQLSSAQDFAARKERLAAEEQAKAAREAETLDRVMPGEQQPEVEHAFRGGNTNTGIHRNRRWRDGDWFEYTLATRGEAKALLEVTYWGGDKDRVFDIHANGRLLATEELKAEFPDRFFSKRYPIPADVLAAAKDQKIAIRFTAKQWVAGGVFEVRLVKPADSTP